ncbi:MAG: hypothetical protein ACFNUJ_01520 [Campylobacter curvus]
MKPQNIMELAYAQYGKVKLQATQMQNKIYLLDRFFNHIASGGDIQKFKECKNIDEVLQVVKKDRI